MPTIAQLIDAGPLLLPGVYDPLSTLLAARAGAHAVFLSGFAMSATHLGRPDEGILGKDDVLAAARRVCAIATCPVIVDIDTGYDDVDGTVRALVDIGAAGCFIEDQVWPKRCGHMSGKQVVALEDYLPKLETALASRGNAAFHVTARTDARAAVGVDEALRRARAFADAGADAVFVEAPQSIEEMARVRAAVPSGVRLVANMVEQGRTPLRRVHQLAAAGFDLVVVPVTGVLAAARALETAYGALVRDGASAAVAGALMGFDELNALLDLDPSYRQ
jgi:methylisocitrate lyase